MMSKCVTALYDCRSKQEYIYRTNKIREISGGSFLLANVYDDFIKLVGEKNINIKNDWENSLGFSMKEFESSNVDGEVFYNGGGNLCIVYKSREIYKKANKYFSRMLLEKTYSVSIIASCVDTTDNFVEDRQKLYKLNAVSKNTDVISVPCNVLPFTQIDNLTYQPIVYKDKKSSLSRESRMKKKGFDTLSEQTESKENESILLDDIVTEKGKESLLAVIYIDGNAMGNKVKDLTAKADNKSYDAIIPKLRKFSVDTNEDFVNKPIKAIQTMLLKNKAKKNGKYRQVIAGGDEITIICNARCALDVVKTYFENLKDDNYACAGIAIFHSHAPFAEVYKIAEQCCESGKKRSREYKLDDKKISLANFVDFHFCRSGITNDMETIRANQDAQFTCRPFMQNCDKKIAESVKTDVEFEEFCKFGKSLSEIGRANIKELGQSIIRGDSYYKFELERIRSRYPKLDCIHQDDDEKNKKLIFDIAQVYDIWFADAKIEEGEINE